MHHPANGTDTVIALSSPFGGIIDHRFMGSPAVFPDSVTMHCNRNGIRIESAFVTEDAFSVIPRQMRPGSRVEREGFLQ